MSLPYLHGTAPAEQERLLAQARFWRDLILAAPLPPPGGRLLEIGCGVGAVLAEAHRVLRPGGTIDVIETDYASFRTSPPDPAIAAYLQAFVRHFARHGDPHAGLRLGPLLDGAGFGEVSVTLGGLHAWAPGRRTELAAAIDYLRAFIEPELEAMAEDAGSDPALLREGAALFRALAEQPAAAVSAAVYRGRGVRSGSSQPARASRENSRAAE